MRDRTFSDTELVLFDDEPRQDSWIVYPPGSGYACLPARRPAKMITLTIAPASTLVERQPRAARA